MVGDGGLLSLKEKRKLQPTSCKDKKLEYALPTPATRSALSLAELVLHGMLRQSSLLLIGMPSSWKAAMDKSSICD